MATSSEGAGESAVDAFVPADAQADARVRAAFARETALIALGARLVRIGRGRVDVAIDGGAGAIEPGLVAWLAQCAGRLAVVSVLTGAQSCRVVEHKIDYVGTLVGSGGTVARASVLRTGGALSVARVRVVSGEAVDARTIALLQATYLHDGG